MSTTPNPVTAQGGTDPIIEMLKMSAQQAANTSGNTQVAPQVPQHQVPQPQPFQPNQRQVSAGAVGVGQGGAVKRAAMQNAATNISNLAGAVVNRVEQRKQRQQQQVFDNFAAYAAGAQQAQGQMQEAKKVLEQDPQNKEALQRFQQAKSAYDQNIQNINDLTSGKNEKNAKLLAKGYGIDDKNAGTPERKAAISAIQKALPGLNQQSGALMSKMPQTQQLTPQAQSQAQSVQAGITPKSPTGSAMLQYATKEDAIKAMQQKAADDRKAIFLKGIPQFEQAGVAFDKDANGQPYFDAKGYPKIHVFTQEERDKNPQLAEKSALMQASIDLKRAQEDALMNPNNPHLKMEMVRAQNAARNALVVSSGDVKSIADGIENGDLPPTMRSLYRNAAGVEAELARRGTPLAKMEADWNATNKLLATLNGPQQLRLRQAVQFTSDSLGIIDDLYAKWLKTGLPTGFKVFNHAALQASKQLPGEAGKVANLLDAQIGDLTSELGTVYKGGNTSTDESLKLAAQNLKSDWNQETFQDAVLQVRKNLQIRQNSIKNSIVQGGDPNSPYRPTQPGADDADQEILDLLNK